MQISTCRRRGLAVAALALWALGAALPGLARAETADAVDPAALRACVQSAVDQGTAPTGCVMQAHRPCLQHSMETPAVIALCFERARETWAGEIRDRMALLSAEAPERLAALAGIEVKYDLRTGLLQCERQEELALLAEASAEQILVQTTRCTATATGLAYVRLLLRVSRE